MPTGHPRPSAVLLWALAIVVPSLAAAQAETIPAAIADFVKDELSKASSPSYDGFVAYRGLNDGGGEPFLAGCGRTDPSSVALPDGIYRAQIILKYWPAMTEAAEEDPVRWFSARFGVRMVDAGITDWHHLENENPIRTRAPIRWEALRRVRRPGHGPHPRPVP